MVDTVRHCSLVSTVGHPIVGLYRFITENVCHLWKEHKLTLISVAAMTISVKVHSTLRRRRRREKWNAESETAVVLHGLGRGYTLPSLSPFVLKLETYLRMAGIKYVFDNEEPFGPKSKTPWITLNKKDHTDSQLIIQYLGKKYNRDLSSHLSEEQRAAGRAFAIMTDEHVFWGLVQWRFVKDPDFRMYELARFPWFFKVIAIKIKRLISTRMKAQGIGLHTDKEIEDITKQDIYAISLYLGKKPFLMGNEPCEADCSVFGMMAQCLWGIPGSPYETMIKYECKNIADYCNRMKEKFWPDWEQCLDKKA